MPDSLIEELPKIMAHGKKEAQRILDSLSKSNKITLQTNELVLPSKDTSGLFKGHIKEIGKKEWFNRLIYGDNLLAMQALLAGDLSTGTPSMRGKIDLIYIDPPFDSKADYRTKIHLPGTDIEQRPTVIEQFAYSDTWKDGTVSYLRMIIPRLVLMRELLSEQGSIYVHLDWHIGHYVKVIMDDVFGRENFLNEIIWRNTSSHSNAGRCGNIHQNIFYYAKDSSSAIWNKDVFVPYEQWYIDTYFRYTDTDGRRFKSEDLTVPTRNKANYFEFMGIYPSGNRGWGKKREELNKLKEEGKIFMTNKGFPRYKRYLDEMEGMLPQSLWIDKEVYTVGSWSEEDTNYATQKP